ncbi:hypothetical protein K7X08_014664 [Anisodus acutangulus]|uniref:Uncharacterized protein n=1 Tax=Anisodus acutangulus TaxID=402998 RepID=A0A9Q1LM08_9SOLA|nr:hypothetical protein K7X08_014664 [Anisodus acutangulus]
MVKSPSSEHNDILGINNHETNDQESNYLLSDDDDNDDDGDHVKNKILPIEIEKADTGDVPGVVPPFSWKKLWEFTGPGFLMSVAFLDPGNLEGDLQAGAIAGYSLLWLLMWSTFMGLLIQLLSLRLGVATCRHLAEICREDFIFLFLENYGGRKLEAFLAVLISTMALSFAWMFADTRPSSKELIIDILLPRLSSKTIQKAVGVVGCVITPHNVFLYSPLVQSRKIDPKKKEKVQEALNYYTIESTIAVSISFSINLMVTAVQADSIGLVNAGQYLQERYGGGLFPILYIWGIGLLAAGQSGTMTGTYARQFIMGGFLNLRRKKWIRSVITRSCAIVPTIIVAIYFNRSEDSLDVLNEWLNVLQGMQIPFAIIPLVTFVSNEQIMGVFKIGKLMEVRHQKLYHTD